MLVFILCYSLFDDSIYFISMLLLLLLMVMIMMMMLYSASGPHRSRQSSDWARPSATSEKIKQQWTAERLRTRSPWPSWHVLEPSCWLRPRDPEQIGAELARWAESSCGVRWQSGIWFIRCCELWRSHGVCTGRTQTQVSHTTDVRPWSWSWSRGGSKGGGHGAMTPQSSDILFLKYAF